MHIFRRVKYQTPESVEIEFILAGIGSRAWALLIDYHILFLSLALFLFIWLRISTQLIDLWVQIFGKDNRQR